MMNVQANAPDRFNPRTFLNKNNVLASRVNSFQQMLCLATLSYGSLYGLVRSSKDWDVINAFEERNRDLLTTCHPNLIKIIIILNSLSGTQQQIFRRLHAATKQVSCVDASPGTGKTFLLGMFSVSLVNDKFCYLVYSRRLHKKMAILPSVSSMTCCRFLMNILEINYYQAKNIWSCYSNGVSLTLRDKVLQIFSMVADVKAECIDAYEYYVLDEDSVVAPWFIFFLYILYLRFRFTLIFFGDRFQQNSICRTGFHSQNNFSLIQVVARPRVHLLEFRIRQAGDQYFRFILQSITQMFGTADKEVSMNFALKFRLYQLLEAHFFMEEDFRKLYISQFHANIKARFRRYTKFLISNNRPFFNAPICEKRGKDFIPLVLPSENKFPTELLLVPDDVYSLVLNADEHIPVTYVRMHHANKYAIVRDTANRRELLVERRAVGSDIYVDEMLTYLRKVVPGRTFYQFPLKMNAVTCHACQGLTLWISNVELDLDTTSLNSFYVAITRITSLRQLGKIHSDSIASLMKTLEANDEYFYRYGDASQSQPFIVCATIRTFLKKRLCRNLKIHRLLFLKYVQQYPSEPSDLMKVFELLEKNKINSYSEIFNMLKRENYL